jgi:hypothetical protein
MGREGDDYVVFAGENQARIADDTPEDEALYKLRRVMGLKVSPEDKARYEHLNKKKGKPPGSKPLSESKDASGHEHKGKGEGGGQFTAGSGGSEGENDKGKTRPDRRYRRSEKAAHDARDTQGLSHEAIGERLKAIQFTPEQDSALNFLYGSADGMRNLSPEDRRQHSYALYRTVAKMPEGATRRLGAHLGKVHAAATFDEVTREFDRRTFGLNLKPGEAVAGFYSRLDKALWIDGTSEHGESIADDTQRGLWAHEMGHALDGPNREYSESPEWQSVFQEEIAGKQLSNYAATSATEGFAEFCRAVYGTDVPHDRIEKLFPGSVAYFRKRGLL